MHAELKGVLLMTYGTARNAEEIPGYLSSVRGGRDVPAELIAEFQRRFALVGASPLIAITVEQAEALERRLNDEAGPDRFLVRAGMQHSAPTIREALGELRDAGATEIVGIVLAPQFSPRVMRGYLHAVSSAEKELGLERPVRVAESWHQTPAFIEAVAERVEQALQGLTEELRATVGVVFTAHSLPKSVADNEPGYLKDLHDTAVDVAAKVLLPVDRWSFAYQSAGYTREEWLKPDLTDAMRQLHAEGHRVVLVVPVQFLSDHHEILYDIDVAAQKQADQEGVLLLRTASLNASPLLIEALAAVAHRELASRTV